jgi:DNA-binding SARP family transcriptional activator/predicted negative regulator of RcsB-dependent stress response
MARQLAYIQDDLLYYDAALAPLVVGSPEWFAWLDQPERRSFSIRTASNAITVRREKKRNSYYWYAYRSLHGQTHKRYLGKSRDLVPELLQQTAAALLEGEAPQSHSLQIRLFGLPEWLSDDQPQHLPAKTFALIAYLLINGQRSREQLIAMLWPESSSVAGRKNLRNLIWTLRSRGGQELFVGDELISLSPQVWIDLRQFEQISSDSAKASQAQPSDPPTLEQLNSLLELYRGPLLDGLVFDDAPELEIWLSTERERLKRAYNALMDQQLQIYRAAGRWNEVLRVGQVALNDDPINEQIHQALMEAYARLGERNQALRQYDLLQANLERELGLEPLPESKRLREEIIGGELHPPLSKPSLQSAKPQPIAAPYVGRTLERAALDSTLAQIEESGARVVTLVGEAGIGKSRLWQIWRSEHASSVSTLETRCLEVMRHLPFAPIIELLRQLGKQQLFEQVAAKHTPLWLIDLSRLLPELHERFPDLPQASPLPPAEERRRLFEALVQFFQLIARPPWVLFVDDLHWADSATIEWLGYLVYRLQEQAFLLIIAYRPEERPARLDDLLVSWSRNELLERLDLQRFNQQESEHLIEALGGDLARAPELYERSAGNPYYLSQLMQAPPNSTPSPLLDMISARLNSLPDLARDVLQAVAVLQPYSDLATLWQTSGHSENETLDAVDLLVQQGILLEQNDDLSFSHPLLAQVLDTNLSGMRRRLLHRRAAQAWLNSAAGKVPELAGRLAYHYQEAGEPSLAADYAEQAGNYALRLGATAEAERFFRQALEEERTPTRLYGLGVSLYWQGDYAQSHPLLAEAHDRWIEANDSAHAAEAALELARSGLATGQIKDALHWIQQGRSYLVEEHNDSALALGSYLLATGMRASGQSLAEAEAHLYEALRYAKKANYASLQPPILFELGNVKAQEGDLEAALGYFEQTINFAQQQNDSLHIALGHNNLAFHALLLAKIELAHRHIEPAIAIVEERDLATSRQWVYSTRGEIALAEHDWQAAELWLTRGRAEAERFNNQALLVGFKINFARLAWGQGQREAAQTLLQEAQQQAIALGDRFLFRTTRQLSAEWATQTS